MREKDELHLVLHDTSTNDVSRQGLSIEAVKSALAQVQQQLLPNGRVVMLIDACFSGFGRDGKEIYKGSRAGAVAALLASLPKVVVLAAAGPAESAWSDLARGHGAFTDAVLDGLYGAAADDKGQITAERLLAFVGRRVAGRLSRQPGGARYQTPMLAGDSSMVIAAFKTPLRVERDPGRRERLELSEFLKSECDDDCPCRAGIEAKIAEREGTERRCKLESDQLAALKARGVSGLPGIKALKGVVLCQDVKVQVAAAIEELDASARQERQRDMEKKAKEDAEQVARAAARKAIEDEFARKMDVARKRTEEEHAATVRSKTEERAAFERRRAEEFDASERRQKEEIVALQLRMAKEEDDRKAGEAAARDPARSVTPGSGHSFRDRLANGQLCQACPEMVAVPAGSFMMGSSENERDREPDEGPKRQVTFAKPFAVGRFEVTFDEWDACIAAGSCNGVRPKDQGWGGGRRPVINVSWEDAKAYVVWLSQATGRSYRLLTEAEWEYAARSGVTTPFSMGRAITIDEANFDGRGTRAGSNEELYKERTLVVGNFRPNAWGINDMHGNVWEWVEDCWNDNYADAPLDGSARKTGHCGHRVVRGGSWGDVPRYLRSASRNGDEIGSRAPNLGLRVARTIMP